MSEYAEIKIENMELVWFRNYLDEEIVSLFFSKEDLIITPDYPIDSDAEEDEKYTRYVYKTTVARAKERLDAQGFGVGNLEKVFNENAPWAVDYSPFFNKFRIEYDDYNKAASERFEKYVTFKKWKNSMKKIIAFELENGNIAQRYASLPSALKISTECDKIIFYALEDEYSGSFYALRPDFVEIPYVFRLILEYCPNDARVELDFSYLVFWDEDNITKAKQATGHTEKTIVLVEGKSDKNILEFALKHLYPHLENLFCFMEFDDDRGGKREGGAPFIVKNMETFYFSKIKARFIAVFDNDAEGYACRQMLLGKIKTWPRNFRILQYPNLDLFRSYPTLIPNGSIVNDDINNRAASIELYLPDDIIKEDGGFIPIEWESRRQIKCCDGTEDFQYQGVISKKEQIKKAFYQKKNQIEANKAPFKHEEWERMQVLLSTIVFAFNEDKVE